MRYLLSNEVRHLQVWQLLHQLTQAGEYPRRFKHIKTNALTQQSINL